MIVLIGYATKAGYPRLNLERTSKGSRTNNAGSFGETYETYETLAILLEIQGYTITLF